MFLTQLSYLVEPVMAHKTDHLVFKLIEKVVFLNENVYFDGSNFWGTLSLPLGDEFTDLREWDIVSDRNLYYKLGSLGLIRSVASLHPVSEVDH